MNKNKKAKRLFDESIDEFFDFANLKFSIKMFPTETCWDIP